MSSLTSLHIQSPRCIKHFLRCIFLLSAALIFASAQAETYSYDEAGRLASVQFQDGSRASYSYDLNGNLLTVAKAIGPQPPDGTIDTPTSDVTISEGGSVNFTGTGTDPDGATPLSFRWDFDGAAPDSTDEDPGDVTFATAGTYTVEFFVTDATMLTDPTPPSRIITVQAATSSQPPDGQIDTPSGNVTIEVGGSVNFTGSGSDPDAELPLAYRWTFGGAAADANVEDPGDITFSASGTYVVTLFVTDAAGLTDPTPPTRTITVNAAGSGGGSGGNSAGGGGSGAGSTGWFLLAVLGLFACRRIPRLLPITLVLLPLHAVHAQSWIEMDSGTTVDLYDVWGSASDDVYAVGANGTILRFDGTSWQSMVSGTTETLTAIYGYGPNDIYAAGNNLTLLRFDGSSWAPFAGPADATGGYADVWSAGAGENLWLLAGRRAWYWDGSVWTVQGFRDNLNVSLTPNAAMNGIGGTAASIITASRPTGGTDQVDGGVFANFRNVGRYDTNAVFAVDDTDIFVVGAQSRRFQGDNIRTTSQWRNINIMSEANDVWGTSASNVYAVGVGATNIRGRIAHYDGNATDTWTTVLERPFDDLRGMAGFGDFDIFVVGFNGTILRLVEDEPPQTAANFPASGWLSDFVNAYTGELVLYQVDITVESCTPLTFGRYYASNITPPGQGSSAPLGPNWRHTFQWELQSDGSTATITTPKGRDVAFTRGATSWTADDPLDSDFVLIDDTASNRTVLLDKNTDSFYGFNVTTLRLEVIEDRAGNRLTLQWDSPTGNLLAVTDLQNTLFFSYNFNQLVAVTIGVGATETTFDYGYENGHLKTVTDPLGNVTTFNYDSPVEDSYITSITLPEGNTPYTWQYAADGRVQQQQDAYNNVWTAGYQSGTTPASFAAPDGSALRISHDDKGQAVAVINGEDERFDFAYTGIGRVVSMTSPDGDRVTYAYDPTSGNLAGQTSPSGRMMSASQIPVQTVYGQTFYDAETITQPDGNTIRYEYDANGLRTAMIDQANRRWEYEYDSNGHMTATVSPNGGRYEIERSASCQVTAVRDPDGRRTQYVRDNLNREVAVIQPNGENFQKTWDLNGRLTSRTTANGDVTTFNYDANGNRRTIVSPDGSTITTRYDLMDRVLELESPAGDIYDTTYDALGRVAEVSGPEGYRGNVTYDGADRAKSFSLGGRTPLMVNYTPTGAIDSVELPDGQMLDLNRSPQSDGNVDSYVRGARSAQKVRESNGRLGGIQTGGGQRLVRTVFDELGRLIEHTLYDDLLITQIDYNTIDLPTAITDPSGSIWSREWSLAGRLERTTDPLGRETVFGYDDLGELGTITYPGGLGTLNITRDAAGRETGRDYSDGVSFLHSYDAMGRLEDTNGLSMRYNENGAIRESNGLVVQYDGEDRLISIEVAPGRVVTYQYDDRGMLTGVSDWSGNAMNFSSTTLGSVDGITRSNGVSTALNYDAAGRLTDIVEAGRMTISRTFDAAGRPLTSSRSVPRPAVVSSPESQGYSYDDASQTEQFSHDALGRRLQDAERAYSWNLAGRVTGYVEGGQSVNFQYDSVGFMTGRNDASGTTEYVWNLALDLPSPTVERRGGVDQRYYVYSPNGNLLYSIAPDGSRLFYHYDEFGNTLYLSNDAGDVVVSYAYTPYGEVLAEQGSVENPFTFMGQRGVMRQGNSDLYYARARFYDASTARFLSRDAAESTHPKRVNPYQYGMQNPLVYRDPTGLYPEQKEESWTQWIQRKASETLPAAVVAGGLEIASHVEAKWTQIANETAAYADDLGNKVISRMMQNRQAEEVLTRRGKLSVFHSVAINDGNARDLRALRGTRTALAQAQMYAKVLKFGVDGVSNVFGFITEDAGQYTTGTATNIASRGAIVGVSMLADRVPHVALVKKISETVDMPIEWGVRKVYGLDGVRLGLIEVLYTPFRLGGAIVDDVSQGRRLFATGSSLNRAVDQFSRTEDNVGAFSYMLAHALEDGISMPESLKSVGKDIYKGTQIVGEGLDEGLGLSDKLARVFTALGW